MKPQIRDYQPADLPALCALVAAADRYDLVQRALPPTPGAGVPLFLFAPRYPLGLERGITYTEVRDRLGGLLTQISRYVLIAADQSVGFVGCATVYPIKHNPDQIWIIEWVIDPACRTAEVGRKLLVDAIARVRGLATRDMAGTLYAEARGLAGDTASQTLLQSVGLLPVRTFAILECDVIRERTRYPSVSTKSMPGVHLRSYEPTDGPAWVQAFNVAFATHWGDLSYTLESWTCHVRSPRFRPPLSLVAVADTPIVGICHTTPSLAPDAKHEAHLHILGVHPDYRRRGLGHMLMTEELHRLCQADFCRVVLDVDTENAAAMRLYQNMGFWQREGVTIFRSRV